MDRMIFMGKVAALCAAALLFFACSALLPSTRSTPSEPVVPSEQPPAGLTTDTTDLGGKVRDPESPCPGGEMQLYRYAARTLGGNARIDEYCVAEGVESAFVHQPHDALFGECPTAVCGTATTSRRGPLEAALLQSVVSLEQSRVLKMKDMTKTHEDTHEFHQVSVQAGVVKFRLAQGTECVAKLEVFQEHMDADAGAPGAEATTQDRVRYLYVEGPTVSEGSVYMEQKDTEGTHKVLALIESRYEGRHDSELFKEQILCTSTEGPISVSQSPVYGFRVKRASRDEWMVFAFLKSSADSN